AEAALFGLLGRLADAGGARRRALRAAGPAPPRRADELPRPRRVAVAGELPGEIPPYRHHHQPRPGPPEPGRGRDPASRQPQADALGRRLRPVRPPNGRTPRRAGGGGEEGGGAAGASAELRRPLPL